MVGKLFGERSEKFLFLLKEILLLVLIRTSGGEDIVGCGGFVKSDVGISYSRVEIKLYTKQGSLKYQTDCAPNNGYYLIPLYDKGDYLLKLEPPLGWSFDPMVVPLHVDGISDPCSRGEDINFTFKGFSITGKVTSKGTSDGPSGVKVSLKKPTGEFVRSTETLKHGSYAFGEVFPGEYIVEATHPTWKLENSRIAVKVVQDNGKAANEIIISGYDVRGEVTSEGEPIRGVHFLLYARGKKGKLPSIKECVSALVKGIDSENKENFICYVTSAGDGKFIFPVVPPGDYKLVPFYKGEHIEFDVSPPAVDFSISHDSVVFKAKFQVQGFSVSGVVTTSPGGKGAKGAKIYVGGKEHTTTQENGVYRLENMRTDTYTLEVQMPDIFFQPVVVKVTPSTPELPEIVASEFHLCGQLVISQLPSGVDTDRVRHIKIIDGKGISRVVAADRDNHFCIRVFPGKYVVQPVVSQDELKAGLLFVPSEKNVNIVDEPILSLEFGQFQAVIQGSVSCLETCVDLKIRLECLSNRPTHVDTEKTLSSNTFEFASVLPGHYRLVVLKDEWCWQERALDFVVHGSNVSGLRFIQVGFQMIVVSSHVTQLEVRSPSGSTETHWLQQGTNMFCLDKPGQYSLFPKGCHQFKEENIKFDTSHPVLLSLMAVKHLLTGAVTTEENVTDIAVTITKQRLDNNPDVEVVTLRDLLPLDGGLFKYGFSTWVPPDTLVELKPSSGQLLFRPPVAEIQMADDCMMNAVQFKSKVGLFVNGKINPPLEGVKITVTETTGSMAPIDTVSDSNGKFLVGPLESENKYEVSAHKDNYVFKNLQKLGEFEAFKLAEVNVLVIDEKKEPLAGVLVSLSGSVDYRKNSVTQKDGHLMFLGLSPGQYFLRPMMKEYQFEPSSRMIDVTEGAAFKATISGRRVAFSCYGIVNSLTGEAEPGVAVEAIGRGDATCSQYQEEALSEQDGTYRIRGLHPGCDYSIRLKEGAEVNQHIERAAPREKRVKVSEGDVAGVRLIVFRHFNQMDVSGNVITNQEFLASLKVRLFREDSPDQAIHTLSLTHTSFFQLPTLPLDNRAYILSVDSSLPSSTYHLETPSVSFRANTSYRHFTLNFNPRPRALEQEMSQGSFLALPLTLVVTLLIYNYSKVLPLVSQGFDLFQVLLNPARNAGATDNSNNEILGGRRKVKPRKVQ